MKLEFRWEDDGFGGNRPVASSDQGETLACSILMDDAGLGLSHILSSVAEALRRISAVEDGELSESEWSTEVFCAEFNAEWTTVYSLLDKDWRPSTLETPAFRKMLTEWRDFIQSTSRWASREIDVI